MSKAEFLGRFRGAVELYAEKVREAISGRKVPSSDGNYQIAMDAATEYWLPAGGNKADPIAHAVVQVGDMVFCGNKDVLKIMIFTEGAWEHLLSDKDAYVAFKKLNP